MSGQLTSKIKIPKSQVELINLIFAELEITFHNQFHKAFPDEETLTLAKQLWLAKLEKYQNEIVFRAIDKIIETSSTGLDKSLIEPAWRFYYGKERSSINQCRYA